MALKFFAIAMTNTRTSLNDERRAEYEKQFEANQTNEFEKLNSWLVSGWTVIASYMTENALGYRVLRFILYKADKS